MHAIMHISQGNLQSKYIIGTQQTHGLNAKAGNQNRTRLIMSGKKNPHTTRCMKQTHYK